MDFVKLFESLLLALVLLVVVFTVDAKLNRRYHLLFAAVATAFLVWAIVSPSSEWPKGDPCDVQIAWFLRWFGMTICVIAAGGHLLQFFRVRRAGD